jgi:hypothetical protein
VEILFRAKIDVRRVREQNKDGRSRREILGHQLGACQEHQDGLEFNKKI